MVQALQAFLDFCYIARHEAHDTTTLQALDDALEKFQTYHEIFVETGVRKPDSTPTRQHSLVHYSRSIRDYGSPNGLCSLITESKHIDAVKRPWRRSNQYNALNQMLTINSRSDKLAAARNEFKSRGMLKTTPILADLYECRPMLSCYYSNLPLLTLGMEPLQEVDDDDEAINGPRAKPTTQLSVTMTGV